MIEIVYAVPQHFEGFHRVLATVAAEKNFIEMIEAPPLEAVAAFQSGLIDRNAPVFYGLDANRVVGWCDVSPEESPRLAHRGTLGMGLLPEVRRKGIGTKLVAAAIEHAPKCGLEKIELHVYTSNAAAIALYKRMGFVEEGLIRNYRKVGDTVFDALAMALDLR